MPLIEGKEALVELEPKEQIEWIRNIFFRYYETANEGENDYAEPTFDVLSAEFSDVVDTEVLLDTSELVAEAGDRWVPSGYYPSRSSDEYHGFADKREINDRLLKLQQAIRPQLDQLATVLSEIKFLSETGHNSENAEISPLTAADIQQLARRTATISDEVFSHNPNRQKLREAENYLTRIRSKVAEWLDKYIMSAAESAGKASGIAAVGVVAMKHQELVDVLSSVSNVLLDWLGFR